MRLWSLHPMYLDPQGLVALWREALLAQAVLRGETRGYRSHPQLERFKNQPTPLSAVSLYLQAVYEEAVARGYAFDKNKIKVASEPTILMVTTGQLDHEWEHLMNKLKKRNPALHQKWHEIRTPAPHPMFEVRVDQIESWERK